MDNKKITAFLKEGGYVRVHKLGEGDYKLVPHVRGLGGGPVLAAIFYAGTKAVCYGGMVAGGVAAIASTGGGAAVGTAATTLTAASAGAGGMGIVAGVETASTFMYTVGMMIPWI